MPRESMKRVGIKNSVGVSAGHKPGTRLLMLRLATILRVTHRNRILGMWQHGKPSYRAYSPDRISDTQR